MHCFELNLLSVERTFRLLSIPIDSRTEHAVANDAQIYPEISISSDSLSVRCEV